MAIKRVDPKAVFKIVSQTDDAIESESTEELMAIKEAKGQTRFDKYLDSLDLADLKFKDDAKPSLFHVRALLNGERADLEERYMTVDVVKKKIDFKNVKQMYLEMFRMAVLGMEDEKGVVSKVTDEEVGFNVAVEIGSLISLITNLSKNLKKA